MDIRNPFPSLLGKSFDSFLDYYLLGGFGSPEKDHGLGVCSSKELCLSGGGGLGLLDLPLLGCFLNSLWLDSFQGFLLNFFFFSGIFVFASSQQFIHLGFADIKICAEVRYLYRGCSHLIRFI